METLTLNDGTVLENSHAILSDERLYVYLECGISLQDAFNLLIDPEKTKKIVAVQYGESITYRGYKTLRSITDEGNGLVTAVLRK